MNKAHSIDHRAHEAIRSPCLFPLILVGLFAMLGAVDATPAGSIEGSSNKIRSRVTDLSQFSNSLRGPDQEIALDLGHMGERTLRLLDHIKDLLLIESLIQSEADKRKIGPIIDSRAKGLAHDIDADVKMINTAMTYAHNRALIDTASKLKDDLREVQELLLR